jgi:hypothetical protein
VNGDWWVARGAILQYSPITIHHSPFTIHSPRSAPAERNVASIPADCATGEKLVDALLRLPIASRPTLNPKNRRKFPSLRGFSLRNDRFRAIRAGTFYLWLKNSPT